MELRPGQRVEVNWGRYGWLPGEVVALNTPEPNESFERCVVAMDIGWHCHAPGFHPSCVRPVEEN